ncbi:hypothetical protein D4S03_04780 [bacterium]|nr:MAG: hypothetical protein D4S03_04780 [bacterium]
MTSSPISPILNPFDPINHIGHAMHQKTSYTRAVLTLCLLVGLLPFLLTALSFARETIRTVAGKVTKVSDGDTIQITTPELTKNPGPVVRDRCLGNG